MLSNCSIILSIAIYLT